MPNSSFRFKKFTVDQHLCGMKVGTDGVLLGAWAHCHEASHVLDVGTGTGLIALMIAQRNDSCLIDALDISEDAVKQSSANFANSPWADRIQALQTDFSDFKSPYLYDLIVSNPPYFANGIKPEIEGRPEARVADFLPLKKLISRGEGMLSQGGILCIIHPADSEDEILKIGNQNGLSPIRITRIIPKPGNSPKRVMVALGKGRHESFLQDEIVIETDQRHKYTMEYKELTGNFYLKF